MIARLALVAGAALVAPRAVQAQTPSTASSTAPSTAPSTAAPTAQRASPADTASGAGLRVFLECQPQQPACDPQFFIAELPFAAWTRDRLDADVHVLGSVLETAAGGREFTLTFIGQRRFGALRDSAIVRLPPAASEGETRDALLTAVRAGLYPFARRTPLADRFTVTYRAANAEQTSAARVRDPWNFWLFEPRLNGYVQGESQQRFLEVWSSLEARRITEASKVVVGLEQSYNGQRFRITERDGATRTEAFGNRAYSARARWVRSLGGRWSAGATALATQSDFLNLELATRAGPVVEYNVFPWREATRRQLTLAYGVAANRFAYQERTVLDRTSETRASHSLVAAVDARQRWGTVQSSLRASSFLPETQRYSAAFVTQANLRLARGLSLEVAGQVARVRDQIFLSATGLSAEEVLTRQRALATSYRYWVFVGVSYTFGSIYNTVVNPRLDAFGLGGRFFEN